VPAGSSAPADVVRALRDAGLEAGGLLAVTVAPDLGAGLAVVGARAGVVEVDGASWAEALVAIEAELGPRWAMWSSATAVALLGAGVSVARSWDVVAVHRLCVGGWRADPGRVWARLGGLSTADLPADAPPDLFHQDLDGESDEPVRPDGHLRPDWVAGAWAASPARRARWAAVLAEVVARQRTAVEALAVDELDARPLAPRTAIAESTAELLCAELMVEGLPVDRSAAEAAIAGFVGPRPASEAEALAARAARDDAVLAHVPQGIRFDLRSPSQVKTMLRTVGVEVPDTRAWRLEGIRHVHPLVDALLTWRKAERVATTFGYAWLDEHLGDDGRFRGEWTGADGAAGRMTASAGLHNMPADLRSGVVADAGHAFVRADLGQIEPRVLAAVSGDEALAAATQADDLYAPVAAELGVDRATAKVAVLGAMYGQTTGEGARALQGLRRSYPVAMAYLEAADAAAQVGRDLRTYGGRLVRMGGPTVVGLEAEAGERSARSRAAARGRFGRNAMVQGAAAELFKVWAVTVRARGRALDARVVLCLHDELLVHVPLEHAEAAAALVDEALQEAAARWAPDRSVRFLADTSIVRSWADAKP
jgi:DNA polymerase-1